MYTRRVSTARHVTWPFVLGLHGLMAALAGAEPPAGGIDEALPFSSIELTLRLSKTNYVLGEPIAACARLTNPHPQPVTIHNDFGWFHGGGTQWVESQVWVILELARDGRTLVVDLPYGMPHSTPRPRPSLLPPGAVRHAKQLLVNGNAKVDPFLAPGVVQVTVKFRGRGGRKDDVASNPVRISISAPQGADRQAFDWLRERKLFPYLGYLLFMRSTLTEEKVHSLKVFTEKYGDTAYAPYARFSLGQMYFWGKQYAEAIQVGKDLAERHPKSSVAEDALYLAAESYRNMRKPAEAEQLLRDLVKRYPDTPAAEDAKTTLVAFAREPAMLFLEDRRLDEKITFSVPAFMLAEEAFNLVTRLTRVPLRVAPGVLDLRCYGGQRTQTVWAFMAEFDRGPHRWVREPDGGYRLVPAITPK